MPRAVTLFITPGRAGTQWLAWMLETYYGDLARVSHEPLGAEYNLRRFLRRPEAVAGSSEEPAIRAHLDAINRLPEEQVCIETGWTGVGCIPLFQERFGERLRLVQLLRHPVPNAISLMSQGMHRPGGTDDVVDWGQLDPRTDGVAQTEYAERWAGLSPYERCLFQWTEIHLHGEELERQTEPARFLRVRAEDMFRVESGALERIVRFAGLDFRPDCLDGLGKRVDDYARFTGAEFDWQEILRHEGTVALARRAGYALDGIDVGALRRRYRRTPLNALRRAGRTLMRHFRR